MSVNDLVFSPSPVAAILCWWEVDCGDLGVHRLTDKQMFGVLEAEKNNVRFVKLEDLVINVAFIRGAKKVTKTKRVDDLKYSQISKDEEKFLIEDHRPKLIEGKSEQTS